MKLRRRASRYDANQSLPRDLTSEVRLALQELSPSRRTNYLMSEVFSKFVSEDTSSPIVRRTRAINKWLATERNNEATNDRLLTCSSEFNILPRVKFDHFVDVTRTFITQVIGEVPSSESIFGSFSGGATTSRRRTESHPASKYLGKADITAPALRRFQEIIPETPVWQELREPDYIRIVEGNVLFTVPKTTEIDRCACKEPDLNMYMQKGVGREIRKALSRCGINLNDQSRNRDLALQGSRFGLLATLDLSSASDSVSVELVRLLLPPHWFALLSDLRSPSTSIDGEVHRNEMFSSMGNGFTFELESLLFYCLARAVAYFEGVSGIISVYGDDIIVPVSIAESLVFVLSFMGFETNVKKSFWTGDFRESCGGHYMAGRDVTPFYVKAPIRKLIDLIHFCNQLRLWASRLTDLDIADPEVEDIWFRFADMVPRRFWGGHDLSDKSRLVSKWSFSRPSRLAEVTSPSCNGDGGYLLWLDTKAMGSTVVLSTSERLESLKRYRIRPVRYPSSGPVSYFPKEVMTEEISYS